MRPPRLRREIVLTRALLVVTSIACAGFAHDFVGVLAGALRGGETTRIPEACVFAAIVGFLVYGNFVHHFARLGHLHRRLAHDPAAPEELEELFDGSAPALAILVPSYQEEVAVLRRTVLSAALQEYPNRRVVVLIDDPSEPRDASSAAALCAARSLPREIAELLQKPAARCTAALDDFLERRCEARMDLAQETLRIAELHAEASHWFESLATSHTAVDHADRLFVDLVLRSSARAHLERAIALEEAAAEGRELPVERLEREHRILVARFTAPVSTFERKRYVNLSHEPNKAMNLNAYIGLLGGSFRELEQDDGLHLERTSPAASRFSVPDAAYLVTLDADTVVSPDYALRLVHVMEQPGSERIAVAQTPYSAFPGAPALLERVAGATTDIQYILHQGFTRYGATFWVGANAVLRKAALEELRRVGAERGFEVVRFVQDRTVIEDTESSVDLVARGWTLFNYPQRLAYSATPPDFGSLVIQRRRWANGGLLILPKLVRYLARGRWSRRTLGEAFMRSHYLASIAAVNAGLVLFFSWPFGAPGRSVWLPLMALPYYVLYGRDLADCGYPVSDLARVYALNLLLVPVNLGGVLRSLQQGFSGRKVPFGRTPKVTQRTSTPKVYLLLPAVLVAFLALQLVVDVVQRRWLHASFVLVNGGLLAYAIVRFIGLRNGFEDLGLTRRAR